jgi:hypothetical protein
MKNRHKIMKIDSEIDAFVTRINSSPREPLPPEDVPELLRDGLQDEYGLFMWSIKKADCSRWISELVQKLPKRFPPSYISFISRYMFPAFEIGPVFLFGNTGFELHSELKEKIFRDKGIVEELMPAGYLQIGNPSSGDYDPICFDTKGNEECPIVRIDHEEILCRSRIRVVKVIASSFMELIRNY